MLIQLSQNGLIFLDICRDRLLERQNKSVEENFSIPMSHACQN
jgi:hypothetical protein